jgi:hypothetical protein
MRKLAPQFTKYPEIFETTYWGSFCYEKNEIDGEIFESRNKFVESFFIEKRFLFDKKIGWQLCYFEDPRASHSINFPEAYLNEFKEVILICSNYHSITPPLILGMQEYEDKLFCHNSTTFIKVFESIASVNRFIRSAYIVAQINSRNLI